MVPEGHERELLNSQSPAPPGRRGRRRLWLLVSVLLLVIVVILAGFIYSQRALLFGSHIVGGNATTVPLHLPPGFSATVFAQGLSAPRFITFSPDGTLFVAERGTGSIVALPDPTHSGKAERRLVVVSGLDDPTSLVFYQGALYVGEASRVTRFTLDAAFHVMSRTVIVPNLPTGGNHVTRTVLIGPDGRLYVSIGSSCNVCIESDPRRATVMVFNLDGSGGRIYARGLRNAVGMAINPWNNQIWVTNSQRPQAQARGLPAAASARASGLVDRSPLSRN
jgi:glucose/arabinose dehydrogenase